MGRSAYPRLFILLKLVCTCAGILGYNSRFSVYYGTPGKKLQPVHVLNNSVVRSKAECCVECEMSTKCKSVSYQSTTNTCLLSDLVLTELRYTADEDADWTSHSRNDWLLIFRAPAGIGGDVYQSYLNGNGVTTHDIDCIDLTSAECTSNYRHPIVKDWDTASFTKVRYSFYKDQAEVAYVEFNATGSDLLSWFRKERVIESTWPDITTDTFNLFLLEGYGTGRRFYINHKFGGCPFDSMYTVAVLWPEYPCSYDIQSSYPQFIYANTDSLGYPENNSGVDYADFIAMFVKS